MFLYSLQIYQQIQGALAPDTVAATQKIFEFADAQRASAN